MFLTELFNSAIPSVVSEPDEDGVRFEAVIDKDLVIFQVGQAYKGKIPNLLGQTPIYNILFGIGDPNNPNDSPSMELTNKHQAFKILPFVVQCLREVLNQAKQNSVPAIRFAASKHEPTRISLYDKMLKRVPNGYEVLKVNSSFNSYIHYYIVDKEYFEAHKSPLSEVKMSPAVSTNIAAQAEAKIGIEYEMILAIPDEMLIHPDEPAKNINNIQDFFNIHHTHPALMEIRSEYDAYLDGLVERDMLEHRSEIITKFMKEFYGVYQQNEIIKVITATRGIDFGRLESVFSILRRGEPAQQKVIVNEFRRALKRETDATIRGKRPKIEDGCVKWYRLELEQSPNVPAVWLEKNYGSMRDIATKFKMLGWWPKTSVKEIKETVYKNASETLGRALNKKIDYALVYHHKKRDDNYVFEPDQSITPGPGGSWLGAELVSPPLSFSETISDLQKIKAWAKENGHRTNDSTGLHINVSIPKVTELDYIKLILFLGDHHVLKQFGREANKYCTSMLTLLRQTLLKYGKREDLWAERGSRIAVEKLYDPMRLGLQSTASMILDSTLFGVLNKHVSIHIRPHKEFVEFRSPGGDWINRSTDELIATIGRFVHVLDIASDPSKEVREYQKKLYTLISQNNVDARPNVDNMDSIELFTRVATGQLSKIQLMHVLTKRHNKKSGLITSKRSNTTIIELSKRAISYLGGTIDWPASEVVDDDQFLQRLISDNGQSGLDLHFQEVQALLPNDSRFWEYVAKIREILQVSINNPPIDPIRFHQARHIVLKLIFRGPLSLEELFRAVVEFD